MTGTAGGGAWGDSGEDLGGQEVTCGRVFIKQADQRQPRGDRHCGRETLHAPTGDTSVHFLWNLSGIPGNQPTSTTSFARGTHPLTGLRCSQLFAATFTYIVALMLWYCSEPLVHIPCKLKWKQNFADQRMVLISAPKLMRKILKIPLNEEIILQFPDCKQKRPYCYGKTPSSPP